jgi:hypothetical protein
MSREQQLVEKFVQGDGKRVYEILREQGDKEVHPKQEVFWWLSTMRHYGLPTRLIDFTLDIRFALFFAVHDCQSEENKKAARDMVIYCFPCKNLKYTDDPDNSKAPFPPAIDMNLVLGCLIELPWLKDYFQWMEELLKSQAKQKFGWDRPYFENPRLKYQKGMFVYPFDYPDSLKRKGESWLVQNLRAFPNNPFQMGQPERLPAKRICISHEHAAELKRSLGEWRMTPAAVYVDYARADISDRKARDGERKNCRTER